MIDGQLYVKQTIAGLQPYPIRPAFYARTGPDFFNNHDLDNLRGFVAVAPSRPSK